MAARGNTAAISTSDDSVNADRCRAATAPFTPSRRWSLLAQRSSQSCHAVSCLCVSNTMGKPEVAPGRAPNRRISNAVLCSAWSAVVTVLDLVSNTRVIGKMFVDLSQTLGKPEFVAFRASKKSGKHASGRQQLKRSIPRAKLIHSAAGGSSKAQVEIGKQPARRSSSLCSHSRRSGRGKHHDLDFRRTPPRELIVGRRRGDGGNTSVCGMCHLHRASQRAG